MKIINQNIDQQNLTEEYGGAAACWFGCLGGCMLIADGMGALIASVASLA